MIGLFFLILGMALVMMQAVVFSWALLWASRYQRAQIVLWPGFIGCLFITVSLFLA